MSVRSFPVQDKLERIAALCARVAGVGWLSLTAAESLKAFVKSVSFANFHDKNATENRKFVVVKELTHT